MRERLVTLLLGGDVMTGRGVDQIMPHPGDPQLWERYVRDARRYVELAEEVNGPICRPVGFSWPWGDALRVIDEATPDARVINLETSITRCNDMAYGKAVHYRMTPDNIMCLATIRPDVCVLANNHVLDFGHLGLEETLEALTGAGIRAAGAGHDADEAARPAMVTVDDARVVVFSFGAACSGIPGRWAASRTQAGVNLLPDTSAGTAHAITEQIRRVKRPGDLVVASIHWGSNWGYEIPADHLTFAHALVDGGVDVVHGHSSHHARPIEVYRGKLVLYGCGDLIDDYEGIGGHEEYRNDLRLLFFATLRPDTGELVRLRMAPFQTRQMRLHHAAVDDAEHLRCILNDVSHQFGVRVERADDAMLHVHTGRR